MRTLLALVLVVSVAWTPLVAEQRREPLAEAAVRGGRELADRRFPAGQRHVRPPDWRPVLQLPRGSEVRVVTRDGRIRPGRLSEVADDRIELFVSRTGREAKHVRPGASDTVLESFERESVISVQVPLRGSTRGALMGLGTGLALGWLSYVSLMVGPCGGNCSDERALANASLFGAPVVGTWIGYKAVSHPDWKAIYRSR